jgi:2-desacetyl-2-hydroxyethyl bacteriochlorophyllide A dehydrogenase
MRQVVLNEPGTLTLRQVADPTPAAGEALVRVRRIGICGTDLHAFAGRQPFFTYPRGLGHELAVTVEQVPAGETRIKAGDACAVRPFLNNPESRASQRGRTNCCEELKVLGVHTDGGMGDLLAIPTRFLHLMPRPDMTLDALALVEPLSIGAHAVARAQVTRNDEVLVIGAGPIGLATAQFASLTAGSLTVVDLSKSRLELVQALFPSARTDTGTPAGSRYDVVFDATGSAASMMRAFDDVAAGGRLVFVGLTLDPITFADPDFHRREITLLASRNATADDFARVLHAIETGAANPDAWITHRVPLDEIPARFGEVRGDPSLVKAVIEVS